MSTAENDNTDFDFSATDPFADEWRDLPEGPSDIISYDTLRRAVADDHFATSHLDDCIPQAGLGPSALARYGHASAAYLAACYADDHDEDREEILRLITAYWLRKSKPYWAS